MSFNDDGEALDFGQEIRQSLIGLDPDARYAIRVRSVDGLGNKSEWSEAMEFETTSGTGGRPSRPVVVAKDWSQSDASFVWHPVSTREDGGVADISHYEVVIVTNFDEPTQTFSSKRYTVYDTKFTYSRAQQVVDLAALPETDNIVFWVVAVSRSGQKSTEPSPQDGGLGVTILSHESHDPTKAPRAQDIGNRILVTMYREHDCTDTFGVLMSTDGDSWSYLADTGSETYVYNPPGDGTYYFKYLTHDSISGDNSAYSPVSYIDFTADGSGIEDHGSLTGLEDDDHPQYLTEGRGDSRYLRRMPGPDYDGIYVAIDGATTVAELRAALLTMLPLIEP